MQMQLSGRTRSHLFQWRFDPPADARGADSFLSLAAFGGQFEIRKLLARMQRADAQLGFVTLDAVDDSDGTKILKSDLITNSEIAFLSAGSADVPSACFD